jgi:hypothetical protein
MIGQGKRAPAAVAAFAFALLYVGFVLLTQLPFLLSRPIPAGAERDAAVRTGAILGLMIECAAIAALGLGILKRKVWAAWSLFVLAVVEIMLTLVQRDLRGLLLPLILGSLALWAANSLRADEASTRALGR